MIIMEKANHGRGQLKKYNASSSNGRHTLTVTMEYDSAYDMGWDVEDLDRILAADKAAAAAEKANQKPSTRKAAKQLTKVTQLALPAPGDF